MDEFMIKFPFSEKEWSCNLHNHSELMTATRGPDVGDSIFKYLGAAIVRFSIKERRYGDRIRPKRLEISLHIHKEINANNLVDLPSPHYIGHQLEAMEILRNIARINMLSKDISYFESLAKFWEEFPHDPDELYDYIMKFRESLLALLDKEDD